MILDILKDARELVNLGQSQDGEFIKFGEDLLFVDNKTGGTKVVKYGPTPEEQAETTARVETIRSLARLDTMRQFLAGMNMRPIFGVSLPTADEGEEGAANIDLNWEFFREQLLILAG